MTFAVLVKFPYRQVTFALNYIQFTGTKQYCLVSFDCIFAITSTEVNTHNRDFKFVIFI